MSRERHTSDHEELRDLCAAYALGALDPPESAQLEEHLREGCEICDSEITEHRRTVDVLGSLLEEKTPPAAVEERLVARLDPKSGEDEASTTVRKAQVAGGWLRWLPAAAALLLAVPALWIAVDSRREVARLERELAAFETTTDPVVPIYDLEATPAAAGARARATFDPRTQLWRLFVHELPPPPAGMIYQGWVVTRDGPHDVGTFLPDETGHAFLVLRLPGEPAEASVRVTLEPEGGSEQPTGSPVFRHPEAEIPLE
jgi:anti-sigma-K factor RskA